MEPLCERFSTASFDENGQLSGFSLHYEDNFNFGYDVVDVIAKEEPHKRAVQWCDEQGHEKMLTFDEIRRYSNQAAGALRLLGIGQGDRVMVMLKRHWEYWFTAPALHKLGAVIVPATHMLRVHDITYRIEAADIKAIICAESEDLCDRIREAAADVENPPVLLTVREDREGFTRLDLLMESQAEEIERIATKATDPMLMYFTSGTTGNPKMVVHSFTYPLGHIVTAKYWQCVQNDGLHLTVADTGWAKCSWGKIYGQWLCGSAVMVYEFERFHAEEMMKVLEKYQVTTFCAPPTLYRLMAKTGIRREAFAGVKHVSTAGEALQEEIIRLFHEKTGLEIMEGFGQSETTLIIGNFAGSEPKRGSMGKPNPLFPVMLVDHDQNPVPVGETGEIVIDTRERMPEGLCMGYEKNEEATARYWRNGLYSTGDTAYRDEDGYYYYVGRVDDVIKSSGYRIGPFEVESVLIQHPSVRDCAVIGVPDVERGQLVKAFVVLQSGTVGTDELKSELQTFVKERTAPYKYPRLIEFIDELPKTFSGKTQYNVLRTMNK
ncbi:MAG: AMP-binding protein [Oscillospiraceae bacterium]|nr:AMP-binding protein [Oscillospiraceae bacterium]